MSTAAALVVLPVCMGVWACGLALPPGTSVAAIARDSHDLTVKHNLKKDKLKRKTHLGDTPRSGCLFRLEDECKDQHTRAPFNCCLPSPHPACVFVVLQPPGQRHSRVGFRRGFRVGGVIAAPRGYRGHREAVLLVIPLTVQYQRSLRTFLSPSLHVWGAQRILGLSGRWWVCSLGLGLALWVEWAAWCGTGSVRIDVGQVAPEFIKIMSSLSMFFQRSRVN